ncbi:hypothetical protein BsWGS_16977 [Bradybaena similaris]
MAPVKFGVQVLPTGAKPPIAQKPQVQPRPLPQAAPQPKPRSKPPAEEPTASNRPVPKPRTSLQQAGRPQAQPGMPPLPGLPSLPPLPPVKGGRVPDIPNLPYLPDIHFSSAKVIPLTKHNFKSYTNNLGKVIVLFFNSEDCDNPPLNKQFSLAAERSASRFAYVDCFQNPKLCKRQGACNTPMLKLYRDGIFQTSVTRPAKFSAAQIQMVLSAGPAVP